MASARWDFLKSQVKLVSNLGPDGFYQQDKPISYGMNPSAIASLVPLVHSGNETRTDQAGSRQEQIDIELDGILTPRILSGPGLTEDMMDNGILNEDNPEVTALEAAKCEKVITSRLLAEYDGHFSCMKEQIDMYRNEQERYKGQMDNLIAENKRLCRELKEVSRNQMDEFDFPVDDAITSDDMAIQNVQQQLQMAIQEKNSAMEMWQTAVNEVENLKSKLMKEQFTPKARQHQQDICKMQSQYEQTISDLNAQIMTLQNDLQDGHRSQQVSSVQVTELRAVIEELRDRLVEQVHQKNSIAGNEEKANTRAGSLQRTVHDATSRLESAQHEINQVRNDKELVETKLREVLAKNCTTEEREYKASVQMRDSVDMMEAAMLEKDQALQRANQAENEIAHLQTVVCKILQQTGSRTREEVDKIKKDCNRNVMQLLEEIENLEMGNSEKQAQIERICREKRAVESELEKIYQQGAADGSRDNSTREELSRRACKAERSRDDALLKVQTMKTELQSAKQQFEQDRSQLQLEVECGRDRVTSLTSQLEKAGEERVKLTQVNDTLQRRVGSLGSEKGSVERKYSKEIALRDLSSRQTERDIDVKLQSQEDSHRSATCELRKMLAAQQRMSAQWKDECQALTTRFETKVNQLREENAELKRRNTEVVKLLRQSKDQALQAEQMLMEYNQHLRRMDSQGQSSTPKHSLASNKMVQLATKNDDDILEERRQMKRQLESSLRESIPTRYSTDDDHQRHTSTPAPPRPPTPMLLLSSASFSKPSYSLLDDLTSRPLPQPTSSLLVNVGSGIVRSTGSVAVSAAVGTITTSSLATNAGDVHLSVLPPQRIHSLPHQRNSSPPTNQTQGFNRGDSFITGGPTQYQQRVSQLD